MKKNYNYLLLAITLTLGGLLGIQNQVRAQSTGFTVSNPTVTENGGNTVFVWKVEQTTNNTGLSHFVIQNLCLPTGSNIAVENSSDNANWTTIPSTTADGSTLACQTFGSFLKLSGSSNAKINFYRVTLKGKYIAIDGQSIVKFGNGQGRSLEESCKIVATKVPKLAANSTDAIIKNICKGGSLTLNAATGYSNYTWTKNNSNLNVNTSTYTITDAVPGTYNYQVSYRISDCESITEKFTVVVNALPTVVANASATEVCDGTNVTLYGSGASTYSWDKSITDNVAFKQVVGSITYTVTGTDANNCVNTKTITIRVKPLPTISVTENKSICLGESIKIKASGNSTGYLWNPGNYTTAEVSVKPLVTTTFTATGTLEGCSSSAATIITVKARPKVELKTDNSIICAGNKVSLTAYSAEGSTYKWSTSSENSSTIEDNPTYTKTYEVYSYKDGCESESKASVTVTVTDCKFMTTYTQGFYGNSGGLTCDGMTTTAKLKSALNEGSYTFGGNNSRSFTLRYSDITNGYIFKLLPGGGTPAALNSGSWSYDSKGKPNSPVDATGKITNNLLAQTITLWLNMRTSGNLSSFKMSSSFKTAKGNCSNSTVNYADTKEFSVGAKFVNKSVNELYNLAIKALTNTLDKSNDPTISEISSTVDVINNAFDQGRYVINTVSSNAIEVKTMSRNMTETPEVVQMIQAYPNPFSGSLTFTLTPRSSGQATLELYNVSGQKVATVFDGELREGEEQKIEFTMPKGQISQILIFNFRQGTDIVQGKLVNL